jgi:hypothetical protein
MDNAPVSESSRLISMSQAALDREDVQVAPEFVPNPVDEEADPVLFHERRRLLLDQFAQIRSKNRAMLVLLASIETEAPRASPLRPPRCPAKWVELLYGLGTPQSVSGDSNLIQHQRALTVVRKLLLGGVANLEDKAILAEHAPILGRLLDHFGFVFPSYFIPALHHLYRLTLFGRGAVGLGVGRAGWPLSAIEGLDYCVWTARNFVERPWSRTAERLQAVEFWETRANALLPGVESLTAPSTALYPLNVPETELLKKRLGLNPNGEPCGALPLEHSFCKEQRVLGCYPLPGWEQKRALAQYKPFEDELGRSIEGSKEHRCRSGLTVGRFDAEVASKGGSESAKRLQNHTKGGFVFCCPHRVIYGFHAMLRGESPRDPFTVLYTRLDRNNLPRYLFYDNACKLQLYCIRREPAFFAEVRFLVDR